MGHISAPEIQQRRVPRRTKLFLLVSNNFQYLFVVPVLALIMFLDTNPFTAIGLSLASILAISAFWTAYYLDTTLREERHPHHQHWNWYRSALSLVAPFLQKRPAWQISLLGWFAASIPIFIATLQWVHPLSLEVKPRLGFDLYWLAYIPVVMWISYRAHDHATEWFSSLWIFSTLTYSACFFVIYGGINLENVIHLMILMGWFLFISSIIHYLFRRIASFRGQADLLRIVTERLRNERRYTEAFDVRPIQNSSDPSLNDIAEHIGTMLSYDQVFILIRDLEKNELFMKGRYGIHAPWPETGWSIERQQSITGWVAANMEAHLCKDTRKCSLFYNPDKLYPCKSEAAVPIIADGTCVGVIDIESDHTSAFGYSDIRLLWQIANSIGAALSYERHVFREVDKTHDLLKQAAEILSQSKNLDEALKEVAHSLREIFKADLVVLYKHAVATCVPLPGLIIDGKVLDSKSLGHSISKDSLVNVLIRRKENFYISPCADEDPFLHGSGRGAGYAENSLVDESQNRFVKREQVKSMIYLKLGIGDDIVGSLFLNYRRRMIFPSRMVESLFAISKVLTMGLILKRQVERISGPLAGATPLAHSTAEAAFESVIRDFDDMDWKQLKKTSHATKLLSQVQVYRGKLDDLRREWTNLILVEQMNLRLSSMLESISHLELKMNSLFPNVSFEWDSREFLNIPTNDFGEVVYKIVAEGVSNALVHAHAQRIQIRCTWQQECIEIAVCNDGTPIDEALAERINNLVHEPLRMDGTEKHTGIISILQDARRWFGADWRLSVTDGTGTQLKVMLPLGMISQEEDAPNEDET
jgi:GAF domain-containing protein